MKINKVELNETILTILVSFGLVLVPTYIIAQKLNKKADCDIDVRHEHLYTNNGLNGYFESENLKLGFFWKRQDDYRELELNDKESNKIKEFLDTKKIVKITDNLEYLSNTATTDNRYTLYEYKYTKKVKVYDEKTKKNKEIEKTYYDYTKDLSQDREYTGNARDVYNTYTALKVEKNKNKYVVVKSEEVTNILDKELIKDYPYIDITYKHTHYTNKYKVDINELKSKTK